MFECSLDLHNSPQGDLSPRDFSTIREALQAAEARLKTWNVWDGIRSRKAKAYVRDREGKVVATRTFTVSKGRIHSKPVYKV